jgi:signal transduction histidine kinase
MIKTYIILVVVVLLSVNCAHSQGTYAELDSIGGIIRTKGIGKGVIAPEEISNKLHAIVRNTKEDSILFKAFENLHFLYEEFNTDSAFYYAEKAIEVARRNNQKLAEASSLTLRGLTYRQTGQFGKALKDLLDAFQLLENKEHNINSWFIIDVPNTEIIRKFELSVTHHIYALLMESVGNRSEEIYHYRKEIELAEDIGSKFRIQLAYMNISGTYRELNRLDSALIYGEAAEELAMESGERHFLGWTLSNLGMIWQTREDYHRAKNYYHKAVQNSIAAANLGSLANAYHKLSTLFIEEVNPDSSLYYSQKTVEAFENLGTWYQKEMNIGTAYDLLHQSFLLNNQQDSAFKYLQLASSTKDRLYNSEISSLSDFQNLTIQEQQRLQILEQEKINYGNKLKLYGLLILLGSISIIAILLYRNNHQRKKTNKILKNQKEEIESTLDQLKSTQAQLIHAEKMASLGELTAGIAHEIQNPLNFVNNFSEVSTELIDEAKHEMTGGDPEEACSILDDLKENLTKISHHGHRASGIVRSMLDHSRASGGEKVETDINELCDEYLRLAYHGMRAKDRNFNADFKLNLDSDLPRIKVIPQDIGRVLLNLINNAFQACADRRDSAISEMTSLKSISSLDPKVEVTTKYLGDAIQISVSDNGPGIPDDIKDKIFQPFFTTKPTGQGTGLGLSLSYDIVKAHGGGITVKSSQDCGTEIIIKIPKKP